MKSDLNPGRGTMANGLPLRGRGGPRDDRSESGCGESRPRRLCRLRIRESLRSGVVSCTPAAGAECQILPSEDLTPHHGPGRPQTSLHLSEKHRRQRRERELYNKRRSVMLGVLDTDLQPVFFTDLRYLALSARPTAPTLHHHGV